MKRISTFLFAVLMCIACTLPAFAASENVSVTSVMIADTAKRTEKNEVVFVREDVPENEAVYDTSYRINAVNAQSATKEASGTSWDVKGWSENGGYLARIPCGSSAHVRDGEILHTWHYTRTYLSGFALPIYGDSGREWGGLLPDSGVVVARGTACDLDIWDITTHYVYYGTTDD